MELKNSNKIYHLPKKGSISQWIIRKQIETQTNEKVAEVIENTNILPTANKRYTTYLRMDRNV